MLQIAAADATNSCTRRYGSRCKIGVILEAAFALLAQAVSGADGSYTFSMLEGAPEGTLQVRP